MQKLLKYQLIWEKNNKGLYGIKAYFSWYAKRVCTVFAELIKHIDCDMEMDFMDVSSYHGTTSSSGTIKILKDLSIILLIDIS